LLQLYLGYQWKSLPIQPRGDGQAEIHYTGIYRTFRRWMANGCIDAMFTGSVQALFDRNLLDTSVVHGDGTTTVAKKGGDNLGFSGHKHLKGDKVVPFCDRNCNVIAPFIAAPSNRNESPLLREALPQLTGIAQAIGIDLRGALSHHRTRVRLGGQVSSCAGSLRVHRRCPLCLQNSGLYDDQPAPFLP
jgi:hypothetical protein